MGDDELRAGEAIETAEYGPAQNRPSPGTRIGDAGPVMFPGPTQTQYAQAPFNSKDPRDPYDQGSRARGDQRATFPAKIPGYTGDQAAPIEANPDDEPDAADVEAVIDEHWRDPDNAWDVKMRSRCTALGIWGEQLWPAFVRPGDGRVRIGAVDPRRIKQVRTDPDNQERVVEIELWPQLVNNAASRGRVYKVISESERDDATRGYLVGNVEGDGYDGCCFYFTCNQVQGARRGHSDLFHLVDWIDAYGNLLFDTLDAAKMQRSFIYDVTLKNATPEQVRRWLAEHVATPRPGTVRAHNDSEEWKPVSPDLKGTDHAEFARLFRTHILGGAGFPEHFYGEGQGPTRATAREMGAPVMMRLKGRRSLFFACVLQVLRFAVDQAILAGRLRGTPKTKDRIGVTAPEFEAEDVQQGGQALMQTVQSLVVAEQQEWITKDTAREGLAVVASHVGIDFDASVEKELLEAEAGAASDAAGAASKAQADHLKGLVSAGAAAGRRAGVPVLGTTTAVGEGSQYDPAVGNTPENPAPSPTDWGNAKPRSSQSTAGRRARQSADEEEGDDVTRAELRAELAEFRAQMLADMMAGRAREGAAVAPAQPLAGMTMHVERMEWKSPDGGPLAVEAKLALDNPVNLHVEKLETHAHVAEGAVQSHVTAAPAQVVVQPAPAVEPHFHVPPAPAATEVHHHHATVEVHPAAVQLPARPKRRVEVHYDPNDPTRPVALEMPADECAGGGEA